MAEVGLPLLVHGEVTDAGRRRVRSRGALHRRRAGAAARSAFRACASCSSTSPRARPSQFVRGAGPRRRRDHHAAAPAAQPQRAVRRRHPPAPLLPAGAEARDATAWRCWTPSTSGDPRFFLGTDSAPHARHAKETACGCAGIYSAHAGIELYAEAFEDAGALSGSRPSPSDFGARLLRPAAQRPDRITLVRGTLDVAGAAIPSAADELVPMRAGERIALAPVAAP